MRCNLGKEDCPDRCTIGNGSVIHAATLSTDKVTGVRKNCKLACGKEYHNVYTRGAKLSYASVRLKDFSDHINVINVKGTSITCKSCLLALGLLKEEADRGPFKTVKRYVLVEKDSGYFFTSSGNKSWTADISKASMYTTVNGAEANGYSHVYFDEDTCEEVRVKKFVFDTTRYETKEVTVNYGIFGD